MIHLSMGLITSFEEVPMKQIEVSSSDRIEMIIFEHLGYFSDELIVLCGDTEIWNAREHGAGAFDLSPYEGQELMVYEKHCDKYLALVELRKAYKNATDTMAQFFVKTPMIHVEMKINGSPVHGLIDTGAQLSIISKELAEKLGIAKMLDTRFRVEAMGVGGTRRAIGKILSVELEFPTSFVPVVLTVFEGKQVGESELIIGVDVLTAYNAHIDFKAQKIVLNGEVELSMIKKE